LVKRRPSGKQNKRILVVGAAIILALAAAGSQMFVAGRVYYEKVRQLEERGYELNGTLPWSEMDAWEEGVREKYRYRINVERKEAASWDEFYVLLKTASNKAEYDGSIYDKVHYCDESYVIWFSAIQLRSSQKGSVTTYYCTPDG
jgi:hypothetical protein